MVSFSRLLIVRRSSRHEAVCLSCRHPDRKLLSGASPPVPLSPLLAVAWPASDIEISTECFSQLNHRFELPAMTNNSHAYSRTTDRGLLRLICRLTRSLRRNRRCDLLAGPAVASRDRQSGGARQDPRRLIVDLAPPGDLVPLRLQGLLGGLPLLPGLLALSALEAHQQAPEDLGDQEDPSSPRQPCP